MQALTRYTFCCREQHDLLESSRLDFSDKFNHSTVQKSTLAMAQVMFVPWDDSRVDFNSVENGVTAIGLSSLSDCLRTQWTSELVPL